MQRAKTHTCGGAGARLSYYAPGASMAAHSHDVHQFSCLLVGEFREVHAGQERDVCQPSVGVKPAGLEHCNEYGPNGALIISLDLEPSRLEEYLPGCATDWRWRAGVMTARNKRAAIELSTLDGETGASMDDIVCDLLAAFTPELARPENAPRRADIPRWLARARDALRESETAPDLTVIAEEAGVHRVHLSRAFSRQFGVPPSLYRRRCRLARAISEMAQGASLADAAHSAGFADQSHFCRFAKAETGYSPHSLRTLLAAA